jgi:hypothetical protein
MLQLAAILSTFLPIFVLIIETFVRLKSKKKLKNNLGHRVNLIYYLDLEAYSLSDVYKNRMRRMS